MPYPEELSSAMSTIGLELLESRQVDNHFYGLTDALSAAGFPPAMIEARLLKIGGDLGRAFANLAIAHSLALEHGPLRPIGCDILDHVISLAFDDEELTSRLETLRELSQAPDSTN